MIEHGSDFPPAWKVSGLQSGCSRIQQKVNQTVLVGDVSKEPFARTLLGAIAVPITLSANESANKGRVLESAVKVGGV